MPTRRFRPGLRWIGVAVLLIAPAARADSFNDLATFQASTSGLTLIDFDTDLDGNPTVLGADIGSTYATLGAVFSPGNFFAGLVGPVSSPNGWINNTSDGNGGHLFDVEFTSSDITAVGVHNALFSAGRGALLEAFDSSDVLLGSVLSDSDDFTLDFFGVTTTGPIARVTITIYQGSGWGLDNLYFGQAGVVPEPSSVIAMAIGLGGLGLVAGRRRRA